MKKLLPTTLVVASCALGLGLAAGSFAIANYAPAATDASDEAGHMFEMTDLPSPVVGEELFFAQNSGSGCMDRDQVVNVFLADQAEFGGQTVEVIEGREQGFANEWRDQTGVSRVAVSGVVGHVFREDNDADWTVDVVEFNKNGCAMSRTLLTGTAWTDLLAART